MPNRDRFTVASGQVGRLDEILNDGVAAMDLREEAFVAVVLVPTGGASMRRTLRVWQLHAPAANP